MAAVLFTVHSLSQAWRKQATNSTYQRRNRSGHAISEIPDNKIFQTRFFLQDQTPHDTISFFAGWGWQVLVNGVLL